MVDGPVHGVKRSPVFTITLTKPERLRLQDDIKIRKKKKETKSGNQFLGSYSVDLTLKAQTAWRYYSNVADLKIQYGTTLPSDGAD